MQQGVGRDAASADPEGAIAAEHTHFHGGVCSDGGFVEGEGSLAIHEPFECSAHVVGASVDADRGAACD